MTTTPYSPFPIQAPRLVRCASLLLALSLGGCTAVGPNYQAETPAAPASWTSWHGGKASLLAAGMNTSPPLRAGEALPGGAKLFDDPVLRSLIGQAIAANADIKTAALRFEQSRAQVDVAATGAVQASLSTGASRQRQSENGAQTRLVDVIAPANGDAVKKALAEPFTQYQAGFDASWELDLWGRLARQNEAAGANAEAAAFLLEQARISIASEVARAYVELRGAQAELQMADGELAAAAELLSLARSRANGGVGTDIEVRKHGASVADLKARMPGIDEREAQALGRLTLLTGQLPGQLQALLAPARPNANGAALSSGAQLPALASLPALDLGLPSSLAERRPDIRAAQARLHAATASIGVAEADLYPRMTIGGRAGLDSVGAGSLGDWASRVWSIGPSLSLPLFDQGRRRAVVRLRTIEQQEAAVAFQQTVLRAWHEVDGGLTSYGAARLRESALADKAAAAQSAQALAEAGYRRGVTDMLPELEARRALLQVRREQVQNHTAMAVALIGIVKATGMVP